MERVPHTRLGSLMLRRRGELGLSLTEAARLAGVSRSAWHALEQARRVTALARTFAGVDRALRWVPGTARDLFEGTITVARAAEPGEVEEALSICYHSCAPRLREVSPEIRTLWRSIVADLEYFDPDDLRVALLEVKITVQARRLAAHAPTVPLQPPVWPLERHNGHEHSDTADERPAARGGAVGPYLNPGGGRVDPIAS